MLNTALHFVYAVLDTKGEMQWRYPNQHRCSFSVSLFAAQLIGILHWEYFLRATTISGHISDDPASLLLATAD